MIIPKDINMILGHSEDQLWDFKSARIKPRDLAKTLMAFANADGGTVVIGVEEDRRVTGINRHHKNINQLLQSSMDHIEPPVKITANYFNCKNNQGEEDRILLIDVSASDRIHNSKSKGVYFRIGDQSRKLGVDEILQLAYDKGQTNYELQIAEGACIDDLDTDLIGDYAHKMGINQVKVKDILIARGLAREENQRLLINLAGVLLFGKKPNRWLPKYGIRFLRYEGTEALTGRQMNIIKDNRVEDLPLPRLIDKTFKIVSAQLREFKRLGEDGKFETTLEYPEFAWQEAIVNAVVHRAYSITGSIIFVKMFDDRFEVESPGGLPGTVTVDNIKDKQFSRNPRIARVLAELEYITEMGEGINRMYREIKEVGLPEPEIIEKDHAVITILRNNIEVVKALQKRVGTVDPSKLSDRQRKAIDYIKGHGRITNGEYRELFPKISSETARLDLVDMVHKGVITRVGVKKGVYYTLSND